MTRSSKLRRMAHVAPVIGLFVASAISFATPAQAADGGSTIATAPILGWGEKQTGTGTQYTTPHPGDGSTFWRGRVQRGDRITITLKVASTNGCALNGFELFAPTVTDATVGSAHGEDASYDGKGNPCYSLHHGIVQDHRTTHWLIASNHYKGKATLWADVSSEAPTFSFVAIDRHRTTTTAHQLPNRVARGHDVTVGATVTSSVGRPTGRCVIDGSLDGGRWHAAARAALHGAKCAAAVSFKAHDHERFRIRYVGTKRQWLPSSAETAIVRAK